MAEKSRLATILCVEEDEEFQIKGRNGIYRIHNGRRQIMGDGGIWRPSYGEEELAELINGPTLVVHKPRFNDEEMTFLRLLRKYGKVTEMHKDNDGMAGVGLRSSYGLGSTIADCLLKPGETVDLDELFKEGEDGN